ncbi:Pentatricopeptide repeat-containing protein [Drosera capensis]
MAHILTIPHLSLPTHHPLLSSFKPRKLIINASATSSPATARSKSKKKKQKEEEAAVKEEKALRLVFMEELMKRAREKDAEGVSDVIYDMVAAGLRPGPRSYHGLVVANVLSRELDGAMQALRRELSTGLRPLHETFVALIRLFGSEGHTTRAFEILSAMEKLNYDIRQAWLVLVEELLRSNYMEDANKVFLKGAKGGLRATDELYDKMIEEDCKVGDHSNALTIAYEMEAAGRMATTFHFNCLLSVQATCGIPEVALATFENMEYGGYDYMKPDTDTYNHVIQAYTRAESYDRMLNVGDLLGMMVESHKRIQPNMRTYALLVECFSKYCVIKEAIRHFRALKNFDGGTRFLHNGGQFGDPLSLYLRALCREGRIVELLEALEAMAKDNQPIPPRAMILSKKYRTLVSSWIEPLQEEAELGYEIDYVARRVLLFWLSLCAYTHPTSTSLPFVSGKWYVAEGGLTGDRKRWVPRRGKTPLDPDALGFIYSYPAETSFKQCCIEEWKFHHRKLLRHLRRIGPSALGDVSEADYTKVEERLIKIIKGKSKKPLKPKAASKMLVPELRQELEAQGLPTDGNRNVLYQRVQKARRINLSRGRPLWIPPVEQVEEEVDEEVEELISRIQLQEGNTEFWKRRFLGEDLHNEQKKLISLERTKGDDADESDKAGEEEEVEKSGSPESKDKEVEDSKAPLQMIGVQLSKDDNMAPRRSKKNKRKFIYPEKEDDEDWFPLDIYEAFKEMRERKVFDVEDMYTIADAWGWTWDVEIRNRTPQLWSPQWEVDLAIKVMLKVMELGGTPTVGDCAMILRSAIKAPCMMKSSHCASTLKSDLEIGGITVSDEILDKTRGFGMQKPRAMLCDSAIRFRSMVSKPSCNLVFRFKEDDEDWFPLDIYEAFKEMRERKVFDVEDMYTIADAWGWTWDVEIRNRTPQLWSPQWEVDLAIKVMLKVIELSGTPTIGDCAMILRSAIKGPVPSSFLTILQITHKLGYKFGSPLYDEVITLCLDLEELDAAIAIVADLETGGITVSSEILDKVISARSDA